MKTNVIEAHFGFSPAWNYFGLRICACSYYSSWGEWHLVNWVMKGSKDWVVQSVLGQNFHLNSQADILSSQHLLLKPQAFGEFLANTNPPGVFFPSCHRWDLELHSEKQTSPGCPKPQLRAPGNPSPPGAQGWPRKHGLSGKHQRHFSAVQSCEGDEGERAEEG